MMKGATSPRMEVCRMNATMMTAIAMPNTYSANTSRSALTPMYCAAIAPHTAARMGAFAPQVKNGMTRFVMILSFSSASVLVLTAAGTEQPKPMIIGMNARPESPNLRNALSRMNATRAI